jgi:hypothetical protein
MSKIKETAGTMPTTVDIDYTLCPPFIVTNAAKPTRKQLLLQLSRA